jgi:hypothetical protein
MSAKAEPPELCAGCVYYPPNLPRQAYVEDDWAMLQSLHCSFTHVPGSDDCAGSRKTSCSLVDMARIKKVSHPPGGGV